MVQKRSFFCSTKPVSYSGSPKRPLRTPRTVPALVHTGRCLARPEAVVSSSVAAAPARPRKASRSARRSGHSTLSQAIAAIASRQLPMSFPALAVRHVCRTFHLFHAQAEPYDSQQRPSMRSGALIARPPVLVLTQRLPRRHTNGLKGGHGIDATVQANGHRYLPDVHDVEFIA